jgi:cbb3-type cytochrome oxidase subunit 3
MFSDHIHSLPLIVFAVFTVALFVFLVVAWSILGVLRLTKKESVTYKRMPLVLVSLHVVSALAVIFTIYLTQQIVGGCIDATKKSAPEPCYDLNEWNWGWLGIVIPAEVALISLVFLSYAFRPSKRTRNERFRRP